VPKLESKLHTAPRLYGSRTKSPSNGWLVLPSGSASSSFKGHPVNITIYFDGGCQPNPGQMYGSYSIAIDGSEAISTTEDFGHGTNNVAEFEALYRAINRTISLLEVRGVKPQHCRMNIFTDSTIVRNRIRHPNRGDNKSEGGKRMTAWTQKCTWLLLQFKTVEINWNPRSVNVQKFGH
jgi:ribonuclease HI